VQPETRELWPSGPTGHEVWHRAGVAGEQVGDDGSLEIRLARIPLRPWAAVGVPFLCLAVDGLLDRSVLLLVFLCGGLALGLVVQLVFSWSRNREGPVMVLDREGLRVRGHPGVAWSEVDKVVVGDFRVRRTVNWLTTLQYGPVVAFVPKAGAEMPPPPGGLKRGSSSWESVRQARHGTNLTVVPSLFTVSARQLVHAAHRLGSVPIDEGDEPA
jgi:hypothetical protein